MTAIFVLKSVYFYEAEGHQKEFFSASNSGGVPDAAYEYDGEGRRVKKISGSEMTIFVYNALEQLAAEYSTTVVASPNAKVSYMTADHLGSPRIITDQSGKVISRKDFTAFGENATSAQRVGGTNGMAMTRQMLDRITPDIRRTTSPVSNSHRRDITTLGTADSRVLIP